MSPTSIPPLIIMLSSITGYISLGFGLVFLIFGVTGCFLNILLFCRRQFRTTSCCTYFLAASVVMFIALSIYSGTLIYAAYNEQPITHSQSYCKIFVYLFPSLSMMYRWMLTAACLDRYALSSANPRLRRFVNVQVARRIVTAIVLIWIVLPVPFLALYDLRAGICGIIYGYAAALYNGIFILLSACGIPIPIMIFCSILIRRNLANKRERRQQLNTQQQQRTINREHLQRKRDQQALVMLFVQIFVYIISIIPWMSYNIYDVISVNIPNKSSDRLAIEAFLLSLTGTVSIVFPAVSFYIYTLTSSLFRKELFIMLHLTVCCKCFINNHRIHPITGNYPHRTLPER